MMILDVDIGVNMRKKMVAPGPKNTLNERESISERVRGRKVQ